MKQERKVIHLHLKESKTDVYFGSIRSLVDNTTHEQIGIKYQSLINFFNSTDTNRYENEKCVVIVDYLITSKKTM